jgi:hypothetical protein
VPELQNDEDAATDHARLVRPLHSNTRMPRLRLRWHGRACRPDEFISHKRVASRSIASANVRPPQAHPSLEPFSVRRVLSLWVRKTSSVAMRPKHSGKPIWRAMILTARRGFALLRAG